MMEAELYTPPPYTLPHRRLLLAAIAILLICVACFPAKSYAEPLPELPDQTVEVTLSQSIRAGTCYDAANTSFMPTQDYIATVDYISVWNCDIQR